MNNTYTRTFHTRKEALLLVSELTSSGLTAVAVGTQVVWVGPSPNDTRVTPTRRAAS